MSAVKPPEWDAMSANEQLLWYLKRLCAKAEEMSLALGVASVGDLPVVTPFVDPAASTTTHTSATPVPDVSCPNTKSQEVLKVIDDAPPACVAMAHTTCSTDGSNEVVAINSVNKVSITFHDLPIDLNTTTAVLPELAVVRNDKEVEQLPSHAVTEEDAAPGAITTDALAQLGSPVTTVAYSGVVVIDANNCAAPALTMCSMECSSRDVVAAMPALAAAATSESSSTIVEFVPELTDCDADVQTFDIGANGVAAQTHTRCSTDCLSDNLNQGSEVLPMSWCVFGSSHGGMCWKHPWPPPQVMSMMGIYCTAPIPMEQYFCSQLLFLSTQSDGSSCITWDPGDLLKHSLFPSKVDDQQRGIKPFEPVQVPCKMIADPERSSLNHQSTFACFGILAFNQTIFHIHRTGIVDLVLRWAIGQRTGSSDLHLTYFEPMQIYTPASISETLQLNFGKHPWQHVVFGLLHQLVCGGNANPSGCYLQILSLLDVQTMQIAAELLHEAAHLFQHMHQVGALSTEHSSSDFLQFMQSVPYELVCCGVISCPLSTIDPCMEKDSQNIFMLPCNLLLDNRCLKCHRVRRETNSKMLQPSGMHGVQPACYFEVGSSQANLKLNEVSAPVGMFENRTNQVWELFLCCKHPPDPAALFLHGPQLFGCTSSIATSESTNVNPVVERDQTELSDRKTSPTERSNDWNSLLVEYTYPSRQPPCSDAHHQVMLSEDRTSEEITSGMSCDAKNSASSSTPNKTPETHEVDQEAAPCNFPWHEKLQGGMQTINMSVDWPFLNQREYKRSYHLDKKCESKQKTGGSTATIQLTVLLVAFECCSPFGATMLGGNAYHLLMVQIITTLPSDLSLKYLLDDATCTVHHFVWRHVGAELPQRVTQPGIYFALFQPKSPRPLHIIIIVQSSWLSMKAITESLRVRTASWTLMNLEVCMLSEPDWDVGMHDNVQVAMVHKLLDLGSSNLPDSYLQQSKILMAMVIDKGSQALSGMASCTLCDQEIFHGGGDCTAVADGFTQGSADGFNNDYFLDISFDPDAFIHDYYTHVVQATTNFGYHQELELVEDHRVHWDPGGLRLVVKAEFQGGGDVSSPPIMGRYVWARPICLAMNYSHNHYKYQDRNIKEGIQWITATAARLFSYLCPSSSCSSFPVARVGDCN